MVGRVGLVLLVALGGVDAFTTTPFAQWKSFLASPAFLSARSSESRTAVQQLDERQLDFTMGYLNKHHKDMLTTFVDVYTELGAEAAKRNAFSGGSFKIQDATIVGIDLDSDSLELVVTVQDRSQNEPTIQKTTVPLTADPIPSKTRQFAPLPQIQYLTDKENNPVDALMRRLNRLAWMARYPQVTGKLIQWAIQIGGEGVGELRENLYLNQVPHNRYVRKYFYEMATRAALDATLLCSQGKISNRMQIISMFPEMNPSMDSYR
jgi:hypothetical protein